MAAEERTASSRRPASTNAVLAGVAVVAIAVGIGAAVATGFGPGALPVGSAADDGESGPTVLGVSGNTTVAVTYRSVRGEREEFAVSGVDPELTDSADGWAFVDRSALPASLERAVDGRTDGIVPVGDRVLLGNVRSATRRVGTATVTVVAPAGGAVDPARKAHFVSEFLSPYALDSEPRAVTVVAAPDALPHRGLTYPDGTAYVTVDAFWDGDVGSVWLHEVVHARQSFELAREMTWFREASAEYLAYRAMQEQYDEVTERDVRARLDAHPEYPDARLSAPATWDGAPVDYTSGVRLLHAIDAAVRSESGGDHTLFDVFHAMNEHDGTVSLEDFRRIVERYSGTDETWIERAVTETGPIERSHDDDSESALTGDRVAGRPGSVPAYSSVTSTAMCMAASGRTGWLSRYDRCGQTSNSGSSSCMCEIVG